MIKTVLFDLDGTLLNTIDDLADAGNWVCAQNGWPTFTVAQFKLMVGNGIPKLVERFSPADARSPAQLAATLAQFTARYDAHKEDKTAPYPGIPALLDALKAEGIQCAVFSNKADALCGGIIAHYFGTGRFDAVRGNRPGVPTKPDPTGLFALMTELGADPAATLFVGDSDVDILTGHNAQLPAMGALWGFRGRAELTAEGVKMGQNIEVGTMIETPAAVLIADELAAECDFFSIGTNDLTQYTCALDRQNAKLEPFFNPHHPAVLRAIKMTIEAGHRHGIWVGICGELGADTALTETFLRMGVDELSMNAKSILPVRKIIRSVDLSKPSEK